MGRILVIRGGAIGDFILTLPAIKLLRENFPAAHLEILGYKHIIALAENRFYANATRSIEYSALSRFFIPNAELDHELSEYFGSFHQVISYLFDPDLFFETNVRRCGVKNFIHASPKIDDSAHAAQQLATALHGLALYLDESAAAIYPTDDDRAFAEIFLRAQARPIIAVHTGSGSEKKNWPLPNWIALGERLFNLKPQPTLLLVGGEADEKNVTHLKTIWRERPIIVAEHLPLHHLAAVLERCDLFIGHDSGISHLAAATGTPCLLLFGPTDPRIWAPANANVRAVEAPGGALDQLDVEAVQEALQRFVADRKMDAKAAFIYDFFSFQK